MSESHGEINRMTPRWLNIVQQFFILTLSDFYVMLHCRSSGCDNFSRCWICRLPPSLPRQIQTKGFSSIVHRVSGKRCIKDEERRPMMQSSIASITITVNYSLAVGPAVQHWRSLMPLHWFFSPFLHLIQHLLGCIRRTCAWVWGWTVSVQLRSCHPYKSPLNDGRVQ